jgi:hypothetical protein
MVRRDLDIMRTRRRLVLALLPALIATPVAAQSPMPGGVPLPSTASLAQSAAMRFPQPVRAGDLPHRLILQPVESQIILGRVQSVVQDANGAVMVVMNFGGFYGFGGRLIAVPIDAMVLLGEDMEVVGYTPPQLATFPTFVSAGTVAVSDDAVLHVGLAKPSH